jgi:lysophospholipase L1-like esterase
VGTVASQEALYSVDERLQLRVLNAGLRTERMSINSSGFRGPEIDTPKPDRRVRIAFLGASTTFCAEVSGDAAVWPQLVVEQLRAAYPGTSFDFVNGGVPGYSVESSLKNLRHKVSPHHPDVIVIYHATNDLSGEMRDLAAAQGLGAEATASVRQSWLERHSLLWELVVKNLRVRQAQDEAANPHSERLSFDPARIGTKFQSELTTLAKESAGVASRVAIATFSTRLRPEQTLEQQRQAAVSALVYMPFMSLDGLLRGYRRYNEIIRQVTTNEGALLIGAEDSIPGDGEHFVDTVHFTDAGSHLMADRVTQALRSDQRIAKLIESHRRP